MVPETNGRSGHHVGMREPVIICRKVRGGNAEWKTPRRGRGCAVAHGEHEKYTTVPKKARAPVATTNAVNRRLVAWYVDVEFVVSIIERSSGLTAATGAR